MLARASSMQGDPGVSRWRRRGCCQGSWRVASVCWRQPRSGVERLEKGRQPTPEPDSLLLLTAPARELLTHH